MAERKSARAVNARKKALEAAKAFQEREERLLGLAEEFFRIFESNGSVAIEKKIADHEQKIEELRAQLVQVEKNSEVEEAKVIARFKGEGVSVSEIASRLDLSATEVRNLSKIKQVTADDQA
ncbi:hypothetical protein [Rothia sp. (in: high G+C Gram-positive bacteria)]|uniref:hypothetical protein n=1 Tax=Rothia sp. (in: high G+C Gram-positive bacteria) TaxID=1885016 RepID=UPI003216C3AD